ncbi:unnamed protein product [Rangifer tarandus platyrhynchus]|uniref:Uncharacterized protein n=2 Tax=Rangifer tarandus platyrhynchus TaxID=3082113 RepID=A0ABN9A332_RANTA|nr:unnamed protein product [Rangifer tarandus platyrhynchus]
MNTWETISLSAEDRPLLPTQGPLSSSLDGSSDEKPTNPLATQSVDTVTEKNKADSILDLFFSSNLVFCSLCFVMVALHLLLVIKECCLQPEIYRIAHSQGSDL